MNGRKTLVIFLVVLAVFAAVGLSYYKSEKRKIRSTAKAFVEFAKGKDKERFMNILCEELEPSQKERYYNLIADSQHELEIYNMSFDIPPILEHAFSRNKTAVGEVFASDDYIFFIAKDNKTGKYCVY